MDDSAETKDPTILKLLDVVHERFGEVVVVADHWEADRFATGFVRRGTSGNRLVYVSTYNEPEEQYGFVFEDNGETISEGKVDLPRLFEVLSESLVL